MRQLALGTSWGTLRLAGGSRAGEATLLVLPQLRLALDVGRPSRALVPMLHVVVSHGHVDHLIGLPTWASQRQLQGMVGGSVYVPRSLATSIAHLLALFAAMEGGKPYGVTVHGVGPGDTVTVHRDFALSFLQTSHWVDTIGSRLDWIRRRLRPDLATLPEDEIRELRAAGTEVTEEVRTPLLAYLADTGPEVFRDNAGIGSAEVVVAECTFLRPADRERARRFGHMHLDDLVDIVPSLSCRHLVLTHLSRRHRLGPGAATIRRALAGRTEAAVHVLNVEWD